MELRHLRYFLATVEAGSVTGAAQRLHVTQPGLSRQLRALEVELGVSLFERRGGGRLTPSRAGQALTERARDLVVRADALTLAARTLADGRLERITIAAPTVTLTDVVSPFIAQLEPDDPIADVLVADGWGPTEALRRGADLAITTTHPPLPYQSRQLAVLPVWAYVPVGHPWASRNELATHELANESLVVLPLHFTARASLEAALTAANVAASRVVEAANGTVAQALAAAGRGVAVVSDDPRYNLVPLPIDVDGDPLTIGLVAAWDPDHPGAMTLDVITDRLAAFTRDRYDDRRGPVDQPPDKGREFLL